MLSPSTMLLSVVVTDHANLVVRVVPVPDGE